MERVDPDDKKVGEAKPEVDYSNNPDVEFELFMIAHLPDLFKYLVSSCSLWSVLLCDQF